MAAIVDVKPGLDIETRLFIGGEFVDAVEGGRIPVLNPHDNSLLAEISEATAKDVDRAVEAARKAFPAWKRMAAAERGKLLLKLADAIEADAQLSDARLKAWTRATRFETRVCSTCRAPRPPSVISVGWPTRWRGESFPVDPGFLNYVTREPLGVVGQIVPWNFPLMFTSWKMGPALAAGNCVVMKPAELTPLSTLRIAKLMADVGFPPGVVNIIPGYGHTTGQYLAEHPGVDKIAFTGSTAVGRKIVQASAGNLKRVQLELGGKGANIIFDDAPLDAAVGGSAFAIFHNQGQACIAGSRLLLHEKIADQFLEKFLALAKSSQAGQSAGSGNRDGAADFAGHRDRVLSYIEVAKQQGSTILAGGKTPDNPDLQAGCYVEPTVVTARADRPRLPGRSIRTVRERDSLQG